MAELNFEYNALKIGIKWIKNIYVVAATTSFASGIGLLGTSIWTIIADRYLQQQQCSDFQWVSSFVGLSCIVLAYFFLRLYIKEKKSAFYVTLYNKIRLSVEGMGKLLSLHYVSFDAGKFEHSRQTTLDIWRDADQYLKSHQLVIKDDIYNIAQSVLKDCGKEITMFRGYIGNMDEYIKNLGNNDHSYDPARNHNENLEGYNELKSEFGLLVKLLKKNVSFNVNQA